MSKIAHTVNIEDEIDEIIEVQRWKTPRSVYLNQVLREFYTDKGLMEV
ncbi:hypothetical protein [uncultured Methanolobus sp.]|nr:hypothetical protein [uncultured Methanolobus sp.]